MMKTLLSTAAALALVVTLSGVAQARETGHTYNPPKQETSTGSTTWMYSALCKAAVPVDEVYRYENMTPPEATAYPVPLTMQEPQQAPLQVYSARDYNYAP